MMIINICLRALSLALCFLLGISVGIAGQGSQMQQNSHVSRQTLSRQSTMRQQQRGFSRPSSLNEHQGRSSKQAYAGSESASRRQQHLGHVGRMPNANAHESEGIHDLNYGTRLQQQRPGVGRGSMLVPGMLAAGRKSLGNHPPMGERDAQPSSSVNRQSAATLAGRGSSEPTWMLGGSPSGQRKPNSGSRSNSNHR
jgi:hypothetical protein